MSRISRFRSVSILLAAGMLYAVVPLPSAVAADAHYVGEMRRANRLLAQGVPDAAVKILESILKRHPADLRASMTYAEALIGMNRLEDADTFLIAALERVTEVADLYRVRVKLRRAQNRPQDAMRDIFLVLKANENRAPWGFREVLEILNDGLDPKFAFKLTEEGRREHSENLNYTILSAVVSVFQQKTEHALRMVIAFDQGSQGEGEIVQRFADAMQSLGLENVALEGLLAAVERTPRPHRRSPIWFKIAGIQERQGKYQDALVSLERISEERKGTAVAGDALLRSARIHQQYLKDPQGALSVYLKIHDDPVLGHHRPEMLLQMADCYLRLGDFENAGIKFRETVPQAFDPEHAELAQLRMADVELFRGNPDSALVLYQNMAQNNPRSLYADQAADRYILLNKYQAMDRKALELLGKLEWARLRGDSMGVEVAGSGLLSGQAPDEIAAIALLAMAEAAETGGNYTAALHRLDDLANRFRSDRLAPEALMRGGILLQEKLGRAQEALLRYESILTKYPESVQVGDARRLVEKLRRELRS